MRVWRHPLAIVIAGLFAATLSTGLLGSPQALADGSTITLDQAKQQLADIKAEVETLQKQFDQSQDTMNQALVDQAALQTEIAAQQAKIDAMVPAFAEMVNARQQTNSFGETMSFLFDDDGDQFINHMGVTATVQTALDERMARLADGKTRLAELNASLDAKVKSAAAELNVQQSLLNQEKAAQDKAQALVKSLTPAVRAGIPASATAPGVQPCTTHLIDDVLPHFPQITSVGTFRAGDPGDHGSGLAADFMIPDYKNNVDLGWQLTNYVLANAGPLNVKYVIWQQSIWNYNRSGRGWSPMADRGSDNANHYTHVHVSLYGCRAS